MPGGLDFLLQAWEAWNAFVGGENCKDGAGNLAGREGGHGAERAPWAA